MAAIKTADQIAAKWASVTPQRSGDYEDGVRNPRASWARNTAAAVEAWKTGVQAAIQANAFGKGVAKAGDAGWQEGAVVKGTQRWGPGVQAAQGKYQANFAPYREAIARTQLPPRYARRDPRNLERVKAVVSALVATKTGQGG